MFEPRPYDQQTYLAQLCEQILLLHHKLAREELGSAAFAETWKRQHRLKEQYKQITGIYPILPPSPTGDPEGT